MKALVGTSNKKKDLVRAFSRDCETPVPVSPVDISGGSVVLVLAGNRGVYPAGGGGLVTGDRNVGGRNMVIIWT